MSTANNTSPDKGPATDSIEQSLFAKAEKIYPREVHGLFAFLRTTMVFALLGGYYIAAWLQWDGHQLLLFDLPARKFYVFGWVFWPQDFFLLAIILILAALALFFFTALAGRLWCGYACPQTVWTEVFLWIERKVEGNRPKQMKLDKAPWDLHKFRIKFTKHFLWIAFSLFTGFTFVGYFQPIRELAPQILELSLNPWATFWILFYGFATYGNAGWMREQVCLYMCPYARFQSAMFDKDTLIIAYDEPRGEPRGSRKRGVDFRAEGLGACIDCTLCVQVCPTGIDIRDGLQYECISCGACIDACNDVMEKMDYPPGLIRYTTEHEIQGKPSRVIRPRILVYAALLTILLSFMGYMLVERMPLDIDVIRDRNALYRETDEGLVENVYTIRIVNMDTRPHSFWMTVSGLPDIDLDMDRDVIELGASAVTELAVRVRVDPADLKRRSNKIAFQLQAIDNDELRTTEDARFLGPAGGR